MVNFWIGNGDMYQKEVLKGFGVKSYKGKEKEKQRLYDLIIKLVNGL